MIDADAMILTASGMATAKNLVIGSYALRAIQTDVHDYRVRWYTWRGDVFEIQVGYRTIKLTPDHRVMTQRGMIPVSEIRPAEIVGGKPLAANGIAHNGRTVSISAQDGDKIKDGDGAVTRCSEKNPQSSVGGVALTDRLALRRVERISLMPAPLGSPRFCCVSIHLDIDYPQIIEANGILVAAGA